MLAVSYAANLSNHALSVGHSGCYDMLLSDQVDTGGIDLVTIQVSKECGFPFPGQATGTISVAGVNPASGGVGVGAADFSAVRVDGRPLPITRAKGFFAVAPEQAPEHGIEELPGDDVLLERPTNPVVILFAGIQIEPSPNSGQIDQGRVDEWFAIVSRGDTVDDFSDDGYWIGGQRASFAAGSSEVAQEFAAFSSRCRANPQLGWVTLGQVADGGARTGVNFLVFAPECKGAGFVVLSISESPLSIGRRAPLDLLGGE
jgi:hypothetical protein